MQIITGIYKGRKIEYNIDGTRPTIARVKESVIAMIQNKIEDSICLDLFSGSGAFGIELLSNHCKKCYFVDKNKKAIQVLKNNLNKLNINNIEIIQSDYQKALQKIQEPLDIIFLDPPYNENLITPAIDLILKQNLLKKDGIIICESEKEEIKTTLTKIKEKKYGDKWIRIYKYETNE